MTLFESSLTLLASANLVCAHLILNWTGGQSGLHEGIHVNLRFPFVVQPCILISSDAALHRAFDDGQAKKKGIHHPNSRAHTKVWESMVEMRKKV